ncbi:MAG: GspH/FimT family pseudopilin [Marinobacter sp.]
MKNIPLRMRGMTLIELLIVLAILAISLGFAVPGMNELHQSNSKSKLVNTYFGAFALTRSQAATTQRIAAICPLGNDNECIDDWNQPVSIFPDADRNGKPDDNEIWRVITKSSDRFQVHSRTAGSGSFHFSPDGITHGAPGSLVICPEDISTGHMTYIAVSRGGRARQVKDDDGDGKIRLSWGGKITCL